MSKISFEDIGSVVATFLADSGVKGGQVVKLTGNGQVGPVPQATPSAVWPWSPGPAWPQCR